MNQAHNLFLLFFTLSQMHDEDRIIRMFTESISEIFQPMLFRFSETRLPEIPFLDEVKTKKKSYGYIFSDSIPSKKTKALLQNAIQMLSVILERIHLENELKRSLAGSEAIADQRGEELRKNLDELEQYRLAALNLIEDLKTEIDERKKAEESLRRLAERLRVLHAIDKAILGARTLEDIVNTAFIFIHQSLPFSQAVLSLFDFEKNEVIVPAISMDNGRRIKKGERLSLEYITHMKTLLDNEIYLVMENDSQLQSNTAKPPFISKEMKCYLSVPLMVQDRLIGSFDLASMEPESCSPEHVEIAREMADQLAIAIQQIQLMEAAAEKTDNLSTLLEICRKLTATLNIESLMEIIIEQAVRLIHLDSGAIYSIKDEKLFLQATVPPLPNNFPNEFRQSRIKDHPHIQKAAETNLPVSIPDTHQTFFSPCERILLESRPLRSLLYVPLVATKMPVGVLIVGTRDEPRTFSSEEIEMYQTLAGLGAIALENARLYKESLRNADELEQRVEERTRELRQRTEETEKLNRGMLAMLEDLQAANKRYENATNDLRDANAELEAFAYSVSHDLKAPLRAITGFSEIISRRYKDNLPDEGRKYFGHILSASNNLNRLIEDLLKYSRLGRNSVKRVPIPLREFFSKLQHTFQGPISDTGGVLILPEDPPVIFSDATLLDRIFLNLVDNAITYRRQDAAPKIEIRWKTEAERVIISVIDNGIGIPEAFRKKVFNIFQRLHSSDEIPGTGIGLAMVKKAVKMLGGDITLESTPGSGSTFHVILPVNNKL